MQNPEKEMSVEAYLVMQGWGWRAPQGSQEQASTEAVDAKAEETRRAAIETTKNGQD